MKTILPIIALVLLQGCTFHAAKYGDFDPKQKTITVRRGADVFICPVKEALMQNGWSLYTGANTFRTVGTLGKRVDLESGFCAPARYSLSFLGGYYEDRLPMVIATCGLLLPIVPFLPTYSGVNISVVDNQTGQEVLIITGSGKEGQLKRIIQENMR